VTLEEFVAPLAQVAGHPIDLDAGLFAQDSLDSVDVVEWLYEIEDLLGIELLGEELIEDLETASIRDLFDRWILPRLDGQPA
jgi:acyl carrier protein